jgi:hypothetical protein
MNNYYITPKLRLLFTEDIEKDSQLAMNFEEDWERIQKMDSFEFVEWLKSATPEAITNYNNYGEYKLKYNNFSSKFKRLVKRVKRLKIEEWDWGWALVIFLVIFTTLVCVFFNIPLLVGLCSSLFWVGLILNRY